MNFSDAILSWYNTNKRDLPWRGTKDPYKVWISEIILQQTRVDQGIPYYFKFIQEFPDIRTLSEASEQSVLNIWKGLGYYSRARNMHFTAKFIIHHLNGNFPTNYKSLIQLKGVGPYTSAAIASICFDEVIPAVDGNAIRVLSRYFGIDDAVNTSVLRKKLNWVSEQLITIETPGDYNQAVMEYGAIICTPVAPKCEECTLNNSCFAYRNNKINILPSKKKTIKKKVRYLNYIFLIVKDKKIAIKQRQEEDIWKNLWEFPLIESNKLFEYSELAENGLKKYLNPTGNVCSGIKDVVHLLSHQILNVRFFTFDLSETDLLDENGLVFINPDDNTYPFPRIIENFLKSH